MIDIDLGDIYGTISVENIENLMDWQRRERFYWDWVREATSYDSRLVPVWHHIDNHLKHLEYSICMIGHTGYEDRARIDIVRKIIKREYTSLSLISCDSQLARHLDTIRQNKPLLAVHSLLYFLHTDLDKAFDLDLLPEN